MFEGYDENDEVVTPMLGNAQSLGDIGASNNMIKSFK
jgi:hypothetical protein